MYDITPLIQALDDRLRYLLTECPPGECNPEEMKAIINLQKEYDPKDFVKPESQIIHISPTPPADAKTIIAIIISIACITVLVLVVLFELLFDS